MTTIGIAMAPDTLYRLATPTHRASVRRIRMAGESRDEPGRRREGDLDTDTGRAQHHEPASDDHLSDRGADRDRLVFLALANGPGSRVRIDCLPSIDCGSALPPLEQRG
jgi:hypothetical protein